MFTSTPEKYAKNVRDSAKVKARPAYLTTPDGQQEHGVIIMSGSFIKAVMPLKDAIRLSNQIADAADEHYAEKEA